MITSQQARATERVSLEASHALSELEQAQSSSKPPSPAATSASDDQSAEDRPSPAALPPTPTALTPPNIDAPPSAFPRQLVAETSSSNISPASTSSSTFESVEMSRSGTHQTQATSIQLPDLDKIAEEPKEELEVAAQLGQGSAAGATVDFASNEVEWHTPLQLFTYIQAHQPELDELEALGEIIELMAGVGPLFYHPDIPLTSPTLYLFCGNSESPRAAQLAKVIAEDAQTTVILYAKEQHPASEGSGVASPTPSSLLSNEAVTVTLSEEGRSPGVFGAPAEPSHTSLERGSFVHRAVYQFSASRICNPDSKRALHESVLEIFLNPLEEIATDPIIEVEQGNITVLENSQGGTLAHVTVQLHETQGIHRVVLESPYRQSPPATTTTEERNRATATGGVNPRAATTGGISATFGGGKSAATSTYFPPGFVIAQPIKETTPTTFGSQGFIYTLLPGAGSLLNIEQGEAPLTFSMDSTDANGQLSLTATSAIVIAETIVGGGKRKEMRYLVRCMHKPRISDIRKAVQGSSMYQAQALVRHHSPLQGSLAPEDRTEPQVQSKIAEYLADAAAETFTEKRWNKIRAVEKQGFLGKLFIPEAPLKPEAAAQIGAASAVSPGDESVAPVVPL